MNEQPPKLIITTFSPFGEIVWLARFNIVWDRGFNRVELTAGILGFGVLVSVKHRKAGERWVKPVVI